MKLTKEKANIVGICGNCHYEADIFLFKYFVGAYQCPNCGSFRVRVVFYEMEQDDSEGSV